MPRRNARYTTQSLTGRCPPAWIQKTREEVLTTITTNASGKAWITAFLAIVSNHRLVLPNVYVGLIQDDDIGNVDLFDMLFWLDRQLKIDKAGIGYSDRLSEAGASWGAAAPDNRADADPLDLWTTLRALGCEAMIVDVDAVDDGDSSSSDGPVAIPRGATACTRLDETTSKSAAGGASLTGNFYGNANDGYRYQLVGGKGLYYLNEANSGNIRFPLNATRPAIWLVRNTVADHIVNVENQIGLTAASQTQAPYCLVRGYPGEWPEVWCGNSTDNDASPSAGQCPNTGLTPRNNTSTIFFVGPSSIKYRDNFHVRNILFHGKRATAGGDYIFAGKVWDFSYGAGHTMRYCQGVDCQPLDPADDDAGAFPQYVDFALTARTDPSFTFVDASTDEFVMDANYIEPAPNDYPIPDSDEDADVLGFTVVFDGTNQRFTRNRIAGRNIRSPLRLFQTTGAYVADNYISAPAYKYIFATQCTDTLIERNYCIANGTAGYSGEGIDCGEGGNNNVVRYNVIGSNEPLVAEAASISITDGPGAGRNTDGIHVYGNILYGGGITFGYSSGWSDVDVDDNQFRNCIIEQNVLHEFAAANTAGTTDAPVRVKIAAGVPSTPTPQAGTGSIQPELGNRIRENNITRDSGTTAIRVRISHSTAPTSDAYAATATTLDGFESNTAEAVIFADAASGDFRITNSGPWNDWLPADMPFTPSQSKAWTPD